ncbi:hypothetical protein ADU59_22315 [Pararhizobium polonicum]|uniref:Uncharacterized protein n=1 Tax=Pararhizobium polonicum TaxID=1612624 RepID=A0A1C7NW43_9HYPH|nr:hypothetical protein [Pararhizobium polonicum]OBZ93205.1 hypothetical protein ADU59_22315 [Pararhizobium polonicum]
MTKLEQIEKSVSELDADELQAFATWFHELQAKRWDIQFAQDAENGALDALANSALAEFKAGRSRSL